MSFSFSFTGSVPEARKYVDAQIATDKYSRDLRLAKHAVHAHIDSIEAEGHNHVTLSAHGHAGESHGTEGPALSLVPGGLDGRMPEVPAVLYSADDEDATVVLPALGLGAWVAETFLDPGGELYNVDHQELLAEGARIGFIWTNATLEKQGKRILGTAELGAGSGDAWHAARKEQQLRDWFGYVPDFLITVDGVFASACEPATLCAVIDHELYHCSLKGYRHNGEPKWAIRGHDIEEFIGVVRRWGSASPTPVQKFLDAASQPPEFEKVHVARLCGLCAR